MPKRTYDDLRQDVTTATNMQADLSPANGHNFLRAVVTLEQAERIAETAAWEQETDTW